MVSSCSLTHFTYRYIAITEDTRIDVKMNHKEEEVLVYRTIDSVDKWTEATCYIGRRSDLFSLFVEAQPNDASDFLALDDFSLADCTFPRPAPDGCGQDHFTCDNGRLSFLVVQSAILMVLCIIGACTDLVTVCDGTDDCGDFSDESETACYQGYFLPMCTFEDDCDWSDKGGDFHWAV